MSSGLSPLLVRQPTVSSTIVKDSRQQQKTVSVVSKDEIEGEEPRKRPGRLREKLKHQTATTRFDSSAEDDEEKGPEDPLQKDVVSRTHWKTGLQKVKIPVREESYDFFTRVTWLEDFQGAASIDQLEGSPEKSKATQKPSRRSGPKIGESKTSSIGEGKPSTSKEDQPLDNESSDSQIGLLEEAKWHISKKQPLAYIPLQTRLEHDAETLFSPSILPGNLEERTTGKTDSIILEDEGLFIGEKPTVGVINLNIMHNRLLHHNEKYWFGEEKYFLMEDNPVSNKLHHQFMQEEEKEPKQISRFVKPVPMDHFLMSHPSQEMEGNYGVLEIEVGSLVFSHHPLFSQEHILAAELTLAFNSYSHRINSQVTEVLEKKLLALRQAMSNLLQINPRGMSRRGTQSLIKAEIDHKRRLELYSQEIRVCREQFLYEAEKDRNLLANVLKLWKELKDMRAKHNYCCTSTHLNIKKKEVEDIEMAKKMWKEGLRIEMRECLKEYEKYYANQMALYKIKLEEWKKQHKERGEAKQRLKSSQKDNFRNEENLLQLTHDEALLSVLEPERPQPPPERSREKIEEDVLKSYEKTRHPPGEPQVELDLIQSSTSLSNEEQHIPYPERKRRALLGKTRIWLKVLINGHTVTQTPSTVLGNSFKAHFNYKFKVALKMWPKQLSIQVLEGSKLKQTLWATIFLQIPSNKVPISAGYEMAEFSSDTVAQQQGSSVGAGVSSSRGVIPFTTGSVTYRMQWSIDKQGQVQALKGPLPHWGGQDFHSKSFFEHGTQADMVQKWMELSHIDPNDPANSHLLHLLKHPRFFSQKNTAHFEVNSSEGDLCSDAELDADIRLRVLQLRSQQLPEFKNLRLVPAIPSQILRNTLEIYENRVSDSVKKQKEEMSIDIDQRWEKVKLMLMSVRRHFQQKYIRAKEKTLQLEDVIHEEQIPDIGTLGNPVMSLLSARRPLKPQRKERGQVRGVVGLSEDQSVKLILYIARAFHVPTRQDITTNRGLEESPRAHKDGIVHPLIEVTFQRCVRTTSAAHGPNPTWNQQLTLPFRAPNDDFSPSSLQSVTDHIYLHMFDEVIHDLLEDERLRETTIHHRIEKRWLGSLKIPFSTLYLNNKIEGTFRLESPVILLGYNRSALVPVDGFDGDSCVTHVSLYLTLEPTLPPPEPLMVHFESSEPEDILAAGTEVVHSLSARFPKRHFRTHILNLSGKLVSLNRFICPLKPPNQLISEDSVQTVQQVAWYVSLIPSLADMTLFPGVCDIWATSDQFLNMLTGDEEEHAVLLTNFFLSLGKKAFLMLGTSIPEGVTCYVLTEEENDWWAWNPSTGKHFSVRDAFSPLLAVYSLVNADNIWFNIQKYDDPPHMNFDVNNSSHWKGFYSKSLPNPGMGSVQPSCLDFAPVNLKQIDQLQNHIELILRDAVMKWRSTIRTPWNRYANEVLRKMIVGLEEGQATGNGGSPDFSLLSDIMRSHKICGVCIHQGYSTMASLVEAVYSTGVHLNQAEGTEFSLVVHLHPYPGDVISVWIYVASLQKQN
ncbi:coiled-coil and C2 domain containing 2A [Oratosquilla oratoria]|uniref:coiled-coil and C2 domain containing 2A n=1 Tax=Oratosquilla oratoria TaxID=337810 RepID=UPI003F776E8E